MTNLEIANLTRKRHDTVKKSIARLITKGVLQHTPMAEVKNSKNQSIEVYNISKRDSYIVVAQLSPEFTAKLVDRWQELESKQQFAIPQTLSEALKLASDQALTIENQTKSLEVKDQPLLATNEASIKAGEILIREFVKSVDIIDLGEKQFFEWMRENEIILNSKNEPYKIYINRGIFTYKPTEEKHGGKFRYTMRVTPRGKVWLSNRYMRHLDAQS